MADLPSDRVNWTPPFTCVAVDCFGLWQIISRQTRGGIVQSKRWAVIFLCLVIRAINIEVKEDMTSSSFNALRRFTALHGPVSEFRSDQGTNFVGAVTDLGIQTINVEDVPISNFLEKQKMVWKFSPPQASHMNGAVEHMIGLSKNILDSNLIDRGKKSLTHEVLCTFMAEVCCIVNSRPITAVSSDPSSPSIILTPNVLLTRKVYHSDIDTQMISNFNDLSVKDMYGAQWKQVQILANQFWKQWKSQYLHSLQLRKKWQTEKQSLKEGDCVIMMDDSVSCNQWPIAIVDKIFPSEIDGLVQKASVRLIKDGTPTWYTRPITKLIQLLTD